MATGTRTMAARLGPARIATGLAVALAAMLGFTLVLKLYVARQGGAAVVPIQTAAGTRFALQCSYRTLWRSYAVQLEATEPDAKAFEGRRCPSLRDAQAGGLMRQVAH